MSNPSQSKAGPQITPTKQAPARKQDVQSREFLEYDLDKERLDLEKVLGTKPIDLDQISNVEVANYLDNLTKREVDLSKVVASTTKDFTSYYSLQASQQKQQLPLQQQVAQTVFEAADLEELQDPAVPQNKRRSEGYLGFQYEEYANLFPQGVTPAADAPQNAAVGGRPPTQVLSADMQRQMEQFSQKLCNLDMCPLCHSTYDLHDRLPKIVPFCGHTICLTCLEDCGITNNDLQCPKCFKVTKWVSEPENLPTNHVIFGRLISNMSKEQQQLHKRKYLILPGQTDLVKDEDAGPHIWDEYYGCCAVHQDRVQHFYCEHHNKLFCRPCFEKLHSEDPCQVLDMYDQKDDQIQLILTKVNHNHG